MFPPRPNPLLWRRSVNQLLSLGRVFGPPPGPADAYGPGDAEEGIGRLPVLVEGGYGEMPYGDGEAGYVGTAGEDPTLVGTVVKMAEHNYFAYRTQTWGGTTMIGSKFDDCRKFIEGACGQVLRQEKETLASGQISFKFYNPTYTQLQINVGGGGESGYGD